MNREIFPGGIYPLEGDVTSQVGANTVTVVGLQTVPVAITPPATGQVLQANSGVWTPSTLPSTVSVNGVPVSNDYEVAVSGVSNVQELVFAINVNKVVSPARNVSVQVNSFPVSDDYQISVNAPKQVLVNGI
jgi:uncharacterized protein (DUF1684 family)